VGRDTFITQNDSFYVQDLIPDIIPDVKKPFEAPEEFEDYDDDD